MYSTYIREFDKNVALLEEQCKRNPAFSAVVREFEVMRLDWPVFPLCVCVYVGGGTFNMNDFLFVFYSNAEDVPGS